MSGDLKFEQVNGQRIYRSGWSGPPPGKGCEVFIAKLPRDCFGDELYPIFAAVGPVYKIRLMMDFSGYNRGYCFVKYGTADNARAAISALNGFEIRPGYSLAVCISVDNARLRVEGIPDRVSMTEVVRELQNIVKDLVSAECLPDVKDQRRGSVVITFTSHRAATMARRRLIPGPINLWGQSLTFDWAEPESPENETDNTGAIAAAGHTAHLPEEMNLERGDDPRLLYYINSSGMLASLTYWQYELHRLYYQMCMFGTPIYNIETVALSGEIFYHGWITCPGIGLTLVDNTRGPFFVNRICKNPHVLRDLLAKKAYGILIETLSQQGQASPSLDPIFEINRHEPENSSSLDNSYERPHDGV